MKILLTGASGFLGGIIKATIVAEEIITLGRRNSDSIVADICDYVPPLPKVDVIIHAAGKAHSVPKSEFDRQQFFNVNTFGTNNLLNSISSSSIPKSFVFISTVAVYGKQTGVNISEHQSLDATDAYGLSKIEAEKIVQEWCTKHNVICSILRLPLIAGINPPGNLRSMINGVIKGYYFDIGGGKARKSIVMATDVANIIHNAALVGGVYNLTDGRNPSFSQLSSLIAAQLGKPKPYNLPLWVANILARVGDLLGDRSPINRIKLNKIISDLTFDDHKARRLLNWNPTSVIDAFLIKEDFKH